ncbi:hypothetical protein D3C80_2012160 [compost metagenome]
MVWVVFTLQYAVGDFTRYAMGTNGHHIGNAHALATLFPAAFKLMCRDRATPQKTFFESWHAFSLSLRYVLQKPLQKPVSVESCAMP